MAHRVLPRGCSLPGAAFPRSTLILGAWLGGKRSSVNSDSLPVPTANSPGGLRGGSAHLPAPGGSGSSRMSLPSLCAVLRGPSSCRDPPALLPLLREGERALLCLANLPEPQGQRSEAPWPCEVVGCPVCSGVAWWESLKLALGRKCWSWRVKGGGERIRSASSRGVFSLICTQC